MVLYPFKVYGSFSGYISFQSLYVLWVILYLFGVYLFASILFCCKLRFHCNPLLSQTAIAEVFECGIALTAAEDAWKDALELVEGVVCVSGTIHAPGLAVPVLAVGAIVSGHEVMIVA